MNTPVQISGEEEVARPAPPGFPDRAEMELLLRIGLFSPDDEIALREVWRILKGQTDDYLDMMLGMVAAHPALVPALTALRGEESATHSLDGYRLKIGDGAQMLAARAVPEAHAADPTTVDAVYRAYLDAYERRRRFKTRPYLGIAEMLDACTASGTPTIRSRRPIGSSSCSRMTVR